MGISNFVCEYLTKKMESEQCVADLLNSVCRANLKDALPPSEWQDTSVINWTPVMITTMNSHL